VPAAEQEPTGGIFRSQGEGVLKLLHGVGVMPCTQGGSPLLFEFFPAAAFLPGQQRPSQRTLGFPVAQVGGRGAHQDLHSLRGCHVEDGGEIVGEEHLQAAPFRGVHALVGITTDVELQQSVRRGGPVLFTVREAAQQAVQRAIEVGSVQQVLHTAQALGPATQ